MKNLLVSAIIILFSCVTALNAAENSCIGGSCLTGEGTMIYSNGDLYIGHFLDGKRTGKGIMIYNDGIKYEGLWQNDKTTAGTYTPAGTAPRFTPPASPGVSRPVIARNRVSAGTPGDQQINPAVQRAYEAATTAYYAHLKESYLRREQAASWQLATSRFTYYFVLVLFIIGLGSSAAVFFLAWKAQRAGAAKTRRREVQLAILGVALLAIWLSFFCLYMAHAYPALGNALS